MQERGIRLREKPAAADNFYALVVGNNDYHSLPKLKTAEEDAREVERVLRETYGFQTKLLLNATRAQIISALATYRRELMPEASLLVYYAGHGYSDKDVGKAYWLPVDAAKEDPANWISADDITSDIKAIPARHVLVISDSCYSGTLLRGLNLSPPPSAEREQFLQKMSAGRSRTLMASGGDEPVADSGGGGHSVFATALLNGLERMERPKFTAGELFSGYVVESVAGRAEQTPEYNPLRNSGHESGDFIFVRATGATASTTKIEVWWPLPGSHVSGQQPFKVMATNIALPKYTMYWQVDGGRLNLMSDNLSEYPHKEDQVDLSDWTWRGKGAYKINFMAKDLSGNVIAQRAIDIYVDPK